jgi:hypothetical protein
VINTGSTPSVPALDGIADARVWTSVAFGITVNDTAALREMLAFKAKGDRDGKRSVFLQGKAADEFHPDTQRWTVISRTIDRENDRYDEVITDAETGEVLHECHEPLSEHRDHGSARPDRRKHSD